MTTDFSEMQVLGLSQMYSISWRQASNWGCRKCENHHRRKPSRRQSLRPDTPPVSQGRVATAARQPEPHGRGRGEQGESSPPAPQAAAAECHPIPTMEPFSRKGEGGQRLHGSAWIGPWCQSCVKQASQDPRPGSRENRSAQTRGGGEGGRGQAASGST